MDKAYRRIIGGTLLSFDNSHTNSGLWCIRRCHAIGCALGIERRKREREMGLSSPPLSTFCPLPPPPLFCSHLSFISWLPLCEMNTSAGRKHLIWAPFEEDELKLVPLAATFFFFFTLWVEMVVKCGLKRCFWSIVNNIWKCTRIECY